MIRRSSIVSARSQESTNSTRIDGTSAAQAYISLLLVKKPLIIGRLEVSIMKCNVDYESAKKTCANRSLYLRQEKHMSQRLLAKELGTNLTAIARLEHGERFNIVLLLKYCNYFDVTLDWLFGMDEGCGASWWRT